MNNENLETVINQMAQLLQQMAAFKTRSPDEILESLSKTIEEFRFDEENNITFEKWYVRFKDLFQNDASSLNDEAKVRLLLRKLETSAHSRYVNYILPKQPHENSFEETVNILKKIFGKQYSVFHKRYQCLQIVKSALEDIITYGGRVNKACEDSEFENLKLDDFKCLIFICGLQAPEFSDIRARLLSRIENATPEAKVNIQTLMAEFQRLINLKADTTMIENQSRSKHSVHAVSEKKPYRLPQPSRFDNSKDQRQPKSDSNTVPRTPCWQCGKMHFVRDCNFTDHLCKVCKNVGHKEGYCKAMRSKSSNNNTYQKSEKNQNQNQKKSQGIFVNHVTKNTAKRKFISIIINGITTSLQLDSNCASGEQLKLIGEFECEVILNAITEKCVCFVTSSPVLNVIGIDWIDRFNLWAIPFDVLCKKVSSACPKDRIVQLQSKYPTVFDDSLGHCTKTKVKLFLKPNVKPVFCPKRPVPFNTIALVDAELSRLQSLGIITPIDFSEWAAPIVAIRKPNGKVRICADYSTGLNEALESNHYPLPTPEEIFAQLNGSVVFSIVDLSDAYLQVEVEDESKHLLTINTHRGLFQFNRLAPGVKSAPGAFQRLVDGMIADIPGVRTFLDDAIIFGKTWEAHKQSLDTFLQRLKEYGFHVKLEKCHFYQTEIVYLGHVVDRNGIRPDPEKLKTIASIPAPTNISELRSFLGAVNFYGRFVRNMHELRHPLDQLLKKDTKWKWNSDCQTSFEKFKKVLQSDLLLTHYDPNLPIIVAADASSTGVGAVIFHKFPNGYLKAIQHASRTLTSAEQGYGQPEKEALALTYGVTKFHKYLLGRKFTLLTDHKPLLSIFGSKKGIPLHTANRLQRWALMLLNYDFTIEYVSTTEFGCADMLSRLIDRCKQPEEDYVIASISLEEDIQNVMHESLKQVPVSFADIQKATRLDETLQAVLKFIREGWPNEASSIKNQDIRSYYTRKESLTHVDGCILFHNRVVVPNIYRKKVLQQFHRGHPGMVRMKSISRSFVFWPGMDVDIENFVRRCTSCCTAGKAPIKETPESWPVPEKPWSRVHVDYAGPVDGVYFLVVVDPYTKWPEVYATKTTTAKTTIKFLTQSFATFGVPETIVSDNGTQFTSFEFQAFCKQLGICHIRTAPYHPQSNGLAERFVDTLKRTLRKIRAGGETLDEALQTFLQVYRTTPTPDKSPAELMFQRPIRTVQSLLLPPVSRSRNEKPEAGRKFFDPGEAVYAQVHRNNSWEWKPASIVERVGRVNYNVFLEDNQRIIRSHANQLKKRLQEETSCGNRNCHDTGNLLTIFFDEFELGTPQAVENSIEMTEQEHYYSADEESAEEIEGENWQTSSSTVTTQATPPMPASSAQPVKAERPRRIRRPPARFEPYW
ncbi:uncharacterized protein K02A2.6-like [Anopheles gambiae]|uniref:uncharacterized protein K02A2.6-like n=1 Tax=Anopheles gambiae TaxID=7165 RepID=UPI002AC9788C|nr:uncharacterized protein K02A2.6-like [Anopheles gambiae]